MGSELGLNDLLGVLVGFDPVARAGVARGRSALMGGSCRGDSWRGREQLEGAGDAPVCPATTLDLIRRDLSSRGLCRSKIDEEVVHPVWG